MNCEALRELLWAYLENETTAEETAAIEKHLAGCAACREELEAQKAIMDTLQNLPDEELPEGYHAELMQKLPAEAAPNVVPFPVKKKQPKWRQLSMIAAAVFVVVAAGGMSGMLDMRQNQYEAVQEITMNDTADMAAEAPAVQEEKAVETEIDDTAVQQKQVSYNAKQVKAAPAAGNQNAVTADAAAKDPLQQEAAMPAAISETEEGKTEPYAVTRSAEMTVTEKGTLLVADPDVAMADLQEAIADAEGTVETVMEYTVCTVIPAENFEGFCEAVEEIGQLNWLETSVSAEETASHRAEIQLKTNE